VWFVEGWTGQKLGPPKLVWLETSDPRPLTIFEPSFLLNLEDGSLHRNVFCSALEDSVSRTVLNRLERVVSDQLGT